MTGETMNKPIECRAAVLWKPNTPLVIETVTVAPPGAKEVRIRIISTGVCGTDLSSIRGKDIFSKYPVILGHEGAGIVESIGSEVTSVAVGDHVIPAFIPECRDCTLCKKKNSNLCVEINKTINSGFLLDGTSRFECKGQVIHHFLGVSSFSEYTVVSEIYVAQIPKDAEFNKVCIIGCGFSTGYGAAVNSANVQKDESCAVFGLGLVGLSAVLGCKKNGASRIIAIDTNSSKFELAKELGATECINPKDHDKPIQEVIQESSDGGLDVAIECIGSLATMHATLDSVRIGGGRAIIVGVAKAGDKLDIDTKNFLVGKNLIGSTYGGYRSRTDIPKILDSYMAGEIPLSSFITDELKFEDVNAAFDILRNGKGIHTVLNY